MLKTKTAVEMIVDGVAAILQSHQSGLSTQVQSQLPSIISEALGVANGNGQAKAPPDLRQLAQTVAQAAPAPKRRGRPPKAKPEISAAPSDAPKKKRGRPPKAKPAAVASTSSGEPKKKRGRPPGSKNKPKAEAAPTNGSENLNEYEALKAQVYAQRGGAAEA